MSRQDANAIRQHFVPLRRQCRLSSKISMPNIEADPAAVDAELAGVFPEPEGREGDVVKGARRGLLEEAELAACAPTASSSRRSTAIGRTPRRRSATKIKATAQAKRRRALVRRRAAGDARFDPRADADPRLSHARPSCTPSSIRSSSSRRRTSRNSIRAPTASPKPIWTGRSSSTRCWASNSRTHARDRRRSCGAPIARRSASSSCTSPIPSRRLDPGAHRGPRQGDHLHARRQARDPQQADRGGRLREIPRRRNIPAPSASGSTAAKR